MPWREERIGAYILRWFERSPRPGGDEHEGGGKIEPPIPTYRLTHSKGDAYRRFMSKASARSWVEEHGKEEKPK